jgi:DNA-binding TFAR19-related protein (PDSD5 family)
MIDIELEMLKRKKMKELKQRLAISNSASKLESKKTDPFKILSRHLVGRGLEVLEAARSQYPEPTSEIVRELVELIKIGKVSEPITGETLYNTFRSLGIRVRLDTKIVFEKHGEVKSLSQKLREKVTD